MIADTNSSARPKRGSSAPYLEPPKDCYIDRTSEIGKNVTIGHFTSIHSDVKIGSNVRIEDGSRIYEGCVIGDGSIVGPNAVLRPLTRLGKHTIFGTLSCCEGHSSIGDYTTINAQCHITQYATIGNCVFIAPFFIATNTPSITEGRHGSAKSGSPKLLATVIEEGVRMGANVRMTPGHTVGAYALIDQDTLITKDVPPHSHVRGGKDKIGIIVGHV